MHWRRKWQLTPVFLPGESQGQGSLVGCRLWGCTESEQLKRLSSSSSSSQSISILQFKKRVHFAFTPFRDSINYISNLLLYLYKYQLYVNILFSVGITVSCSVVSDSLQPHGLHPTRLLCPWDSQARILEWVAIPFSRVSSCPRD